MKLSSKGQYAVRAIIDLSYYSKNNLVPISLKDIAKRESISIHYLEQIFFTLKKAGIVRSLRGPNGGYLLNKKSSEILIGDIIASVEPIEIVSCIGKTNHAKDCERRSVCLAFDMWNSISSKIIEFLNSITVEDVINEYSQKQDKNSNKGSNKSLNKNISNIYRSNQSKCNQGKSPAIKSALK